MDKRQFIPMVEKVKESTGEYPDEVSSDAGFFSEDNVKYASEKGIDPYISPDKIKHGERYPPQRGRKAKNLGIKELMRRKLRSKRGWKTFSKRKESTEPFIGQIKQVRGFRQFLLRGIEKVKAEWDLICLTHNILKLYRAGYRYATVPR